MTEIGKMLREDGVKEGMKKGKEEGKAEILIKQLIKKFKAIPEEYKENIKKLDEETIDGCYCYGYFDINTLEELERYFK